MRDQELLIAPLPCSLDRRSVLQKNTIEFLPIWNREDLSRDFGTVSSPRHETPPIVVAQVC
ncbi:MAG: hypothetical protein EON59_00245 [Alphaproteobacteria bacterium]|nr:MAG: hypothetical protein EON59_00245 [Alphaproteobacteria bacterium]